MLPSEYEKHKPEKHSTPETQTLTLRAKRYLTRRRLDFNHPMFTEDRHTWDFVNGLCSDIPLCCVLEFCAFGTFLEDWPELDVIATNETNKMFSFEDEVKNYRMCLECAIKAGKIPIG